MPDHKFGKEDRAGRRVIIDNRFRMGDSSGVVGAARSNVERSVEAHNETKRRAEDRPVSVGDRI